MKNLYQQKANPYLDSRWYGLYGPNGLGIFNDWNKCRAANKYVGQFSKYLRFESEAEALQWITVNYPEMIRVLFNFEICPIPPLAINKLVFTRDLRIKSPNSQVYEQKPVAPNPKAEPAMGIKFECFPKK